ncbi:MAG TPA: hypothetical protein VK927_04400, partial [Adhaeribacter sp.]|nr:hypothetical protein [Adhaeribacter sp.]
LLKLGRPETARLLVNLLNRPDKLEVLSNQYLTSGRFSLIIAGIFFAAVLLGLLAALSYNYRSRTARSGAWFTSESGNLVRAFLQQFTELNKRQTAMLLTFMAAFLGVQLYLLNWFPAHTDEAFSYVFFVHKGLLTVVSYYPLPNNHVFYNLLCLPFEMAGLPPLLVMRLPAFFMAWATGLLLFGLVKKQCDFKAGFLAMALFSSGVYSLYYAVHGRGYMLLTFFALLAGWAVLQFCRNGRKIYLPVMVFASALGFYTVPVYAYAFASVGLFGAAVLLFNRKFIAFRQFALAGFGAVFLTLFLYSPILLTSGFGAFYGNDVQQVAALDFSRNFPVYLQTIPDNYWGLGIFSLLLPAALLLLFFRKGSAGNKDGKLNAIFLSWTVLSVLLWIVVPQLMPPGRTWLYWSLFVCWGLALLLSPLFGSNKISENGNYLLLLFFGLGWLGFQTYSLKQKVKSGEIQVFWPLPAIIEEVLNSPAERVFAGHENYDLLLQYEALKAKRPLQVDLYEFRPPYDYVLVPVRKPFPENADSAAYLKV